MHARPRRSYDYLFKVVLIGDSGVDIQTARNAGVPSCGVTYGFQPDTLKIYQPDVLVDDLRDFAARFFKP